MKDDLSQKNRWKYDISSNVLKRWSFQNNCTGIWSFLLYYLERWYFFFTKIWSYSLDGKWKMIFLIKNTWKHDIFFKCPEKMVFPKRIALEYDLSCIIWKGGIFFLLRYDIFSLDGKWKMIFLKKYLEIYFLYVCINVTNLIFPRKNTLKSVWHSRSYYRKSSNDFLYFYGDLNRRFHILLSSEKKKKKNKKLNI